MKMLCRFAARALQYQRRLPRKSHYQRVASLQNVAAAENSEPTSDSSSEGPPEPHIVNPLSEPDFFGVSEMVGVRQLMESRVHLGHKAGKWNPLMKPYIYGVRSGMHIINLDETLRHLLLALNVTAHIAYRRGVVLFVNERPQFEGLNQHTARECGEYFVSSWKGGTLTNSFMLLKTLRLPDLIIFTSVPKSKTAIKEAAMSNIPSVGIVDTDCNPNAIMYPVPGNDDTPTSLRLYYRLFGDVITKAKKMREEFEQTKAQNIESYQSNLEN